MVPPCWPRRSTCAARQPCWAALAAVIGLATQFEYLLHTDFGIDDLLVETYVLTGVSDPGRMAPNSTLALSLIGLALLGLSLRPKASVWNVWPALLGSIVIAIGTAALVGYAAGIPGAYCWGNFNAMAVHTAIGFTLLGGGIAAWRGIKHSRAPGKRRRGCRVLASSRAVSVTLCMWYGLAFYHPPVSGAVAAVRHRGRPSFRRHPCHRAPHGSPAGMVGASRPDRSPACSLARNHKRRTQSGNPGSRLGRRSQAPTRGHRGVLGRCHTRHHLDRYGAHLELGR